MRIGLADIPVAEKSTVGSGAARNARVAKEKRPQSTELDIAHLNSLDAQSVHCLRPVFVRAVQRARARGSEHRFELAPFEVMVWRLSDSVTGRPRRRALPLIGLMAVDIIASRHESVFLL